MVHVLDQEVGPKGPQEHKLKYYIASGCYKQYVHGRNKDWFNWPTGSTDPRSPLHVGYNIAVWA